MGKNVTLKDVAERCGVSDVTVSRALRQRFGNMSQVTAERILHTAREMGYDSANNLAARRLVSARTGQAVLNHTIALYFPLESAGLPYFAALLRGIYAVLREERFAVVTNLSEDPDETTPLLPIFARGDIDGALVIPGGITLSVLLHKLRSEPGFGTRPVVSLQEPHADCSAILADDDAGGFAIGDHLLTLGHRRLLHLYAAPPGQEVPLLYCHRIEGLHRAARRQGLDPERTYRSMTWGIPFPYTLEEAKRLLLAHLEGPEKISAVIARNDEAAGQVYSLLTQAGVRVPEDVSLVGFDDTETIADAHGANRLTTVQIPLEEIARRGARLLIDRITGIAPHDESQVLSATLQVRGTTAPAREQ